MLVLCVRFRFRVRWKPRNEQLAQMGSFHQSKRSDNKHYAVEARWGIFLRIWRIFLFFRALVNIPIQTLIIPPWPLLRKMIISQLELGPPVVERTVRRGDNILIHMHLSWNFEGMICINKPYVSVADKFHSRTHFK